MQNLAWTLSLILMAIVAAIFLWVVVGASRKAGDAAAIAPPAFGWRDAPVLARHRGRRRHLVRHAVGVADRGPRRAAAKPDAVIRATGHQWRWTLDQDTVKVGQLVEFEVTATDVNHGFAIYKDKNHVVAQAQAMPGYVNKLQVRFTEPGRLRGAVPRILRPRASRHARGHQSPRRILKER